MKAVGMTLFRILKNGSAREYSAVRFRRGAEGVDRTLRQFAAVGWTDTDDYGYGVLDILDDSGDIVSDIGVPNARAFQAIKRKLGLRVEEN